MRQSTRAQIILFLAIAIASVPIQLYAKDHWGNQSPNVVLILADDLGWRDLHCTGSDFYETPNLDALATRSTRFTQGYAACQVCSPSRAAIMTGKFPARMKTTDWFGAAAGEQWKRNTKLLPADYVRQLPSEETTIAEAFKAAGYKTFFAGKWHLGDQGSFPEDHGFDVNVGGHHRGSPPGGFFSPYENPKMQDGPAGESLPLRLGKETSQFIAAHHDQPFFAMLSFYSVHAPLETTETLWRKYQQKATQNPLPKSRFIIDRTLQPVRQVQDHPVYAGMIESMDAAVGLVLQQLKDSKIDDNTIIVFTSDNGGVSAGDAKATSNLPLRGGKGRQWEGGIREPFFISVPGKTTGHSNDTPVIATDLFPTLLELCGIPLLPQQHLDGTSLVPLLKAQATAGQAAAGQTTAGQTTASQTTAGQIIAGRPLYWHYPHYGNQGGEPSAIIRQGNYKLIYYFEDSRTELYNLLEDIGEQKDLTISKPELSTAMNEKLQKWLKDIDANLPSINPDYDASAADEAMDRLIKRGIINLEAEHARFLNDKYQPNPNWWDSQSQK